MIGTTLSHYKILERIGGGGFATVYLALDTRTNEVVALKVLHPQHSRDETFVERFWREAQAIYDMANHPHVVQLHEFGEEDGNYFLAMEYLEGQDLSDLLAQQGALPVEQTLSIATQIARALEATHANGITHRDIKPANVKITPQGVAKLIDFGIVKAARHDTKLTQVDTFIGTPEYLSPEVWEGEPADIRADLYALGVVLYEMLAGRAPFRADSAPAVMRQHLMEQPVPLADVREDVPGWLVSLLERLLAKKPEDRYQTPSALLYDLENETVSARTATRASLFGRQPAWLWGGTAALTLLFVVVLASNVWGTNVDAGFERGEDPKIAVAGETVTVPIPVSATNTSAPTPTETATQTPTGTPTPTPTRTKTPASTASATPAPQATVFRNSPAPAFESPTGKYAPPTLVAPEDGIEVTTFPITLQWAWEGALETDEWFEVRLWTEGMPHYGIAWTKARRLTFTDPGYRVAGVFFWSVAIIQGEDGQRTATLSEEAAPRSAIVRSGNTPSQ